MALVLGCLAPDVFSGVAAAAGPAPGTGVTEVSAVSTSADRAGGVCRALAGGSAASFDRQRAVLVTGTADHVVAQGYAPLEAEMLAAIYAEAGGGVELSSAPLDVSALEGHEPRGEGTVWSDASSPRVALLVVDGMGHAWPAGAGPDGACESAFVTCTGPSLAAYLADLFDPAAQPPDGDADAGPEPPGGEPGCSCAAPGTGARGSIAALVVTLALALRRRTTDAL
jgi:poly(3-hydroxybutyrate) depolymerase